MLQKMPIGKTLRNSFRRIRAAPLQKQDQVKEANSEHYLINEVRKASSGSTAGSVVGNRRALWSSKVDEHNAKQALNPFSDKYAGPKKLDKTDPNYGRPDANSLTAQRARDGEAKLKQEVLDLCNVIFDHGVRTGDGRASIQFGKLFNIYNAINDKCVGLLIRARKKRLLTFEGEMLFQRRDDEKWISLTKNMNTINCCFGRSADIEGGGVVDQSDPDVQAMQQGQPAQRPAEEPAEAVEIIASSTKAIAPSSSSNSNYNPFTMGPLKKLSLKLRRREAPDEDDASSSQDNKGHNAVVDLEGPKNNRGLAEDCNEITVVGPHDDEGLLAQGRVERKPSFVRVPKLSFRRISGHRKPSSASSSAAGEQHRPTRVSPPDGPQTTEDGKDARSGSGPVVVVQPLKVKTKKLSIRLKPSSSVVTSNKPIKAPKRNPSGEPLLPGSADAAEPSPSSNDLLQGSGQSFGAHESGHLDDDVAKKSSFQGLRSGKPSEAAVSHSGPETGGGPTSGGDTAGLETVKTRWTRALGLSVAVSRFNSKVRRQGKNGGDLPSQANGGAA